MLLLSKVQSLIGLLGTFTNIITDIPSQVIDYIFDNDDPIFHYAFPECHIIAANDIARNGFPEDFLFGVTTSAYQTEGAWNVSGKAETDWDHFTHLRPELIKDKSNADIAADSYSKYVEDISLAQDIGSNVYRLSLSWSRLFPNGFSNYVSHEALWHYVNVIDEICDLGMEPLVVLFDKEMPYLFTKLGGFTNSFINETFVSLAKLAFTSFADQVKYWVTFNEPNTLCRWSYGGSVIPGYNQSGIADYLCGHNILLIHSKIYEIYRKKYYPTYKGKVGISVNFTWWEPKDATSEADVKAADRAYQWYNSWMVNPIFSATGDYPELMKQRINYHSFLQDFPFSRLPVFTPEEIKHVKGSADFLGVNFYTTSLVSDFVGDVISFDDDAGISSSISNYPGDSWIKNTPWALGLLLQRLRGELALPEIFITANGYMDNGGTEDSGRVVYHFQHMREVLKAIKQGLNIRGYLAASLIDGFEWSFGYEKRHGLYHVDFADKNRRRTAKLSARMVADVFHTRRVRPIDEVFNETFARDSLKIYGAPDNK